MMRSFLSLAALCLTLSFLGCASAPGDVTSANGIALVRISDTDIAGLLEGETVTLDLSAPSVIYEVELADVADYERIIVMVDGQEPVSLDAWLARYPAELGARVRLAGNASDLWRFDHPAQSADDDVAGQTQSLRVGGRVIGGRAVGRVRGELGYSCGPFSCTCTGDDDCNDMFESDVCRGDSVCDESGCWCWRWGGLIGS